MTDIKHPLVATPVGPSPTCPDGGTCHHRCGASCFRVRQCAPLSGYGDDWPDDVKRKHALMKCRDPKMPKVVTPLSTAEAIALGAAKYTLSKRTRESAEAGKLVRLRRAEHERCKAATGLPPDEHETKLTWTRFSLDEAHAERRKAKRRSREAQRAWLVTQSVRRRSSSQSATRTTRTGTSTSA